MKKRIKLMAIIPAIIVLVAGSNIYKSQKTVLVSDLTLANVEALASSSETPEEFTKATCCEAVLYSSTCQGCDGEKHSYAKRI